MSWLDSLPARIFGTRNRRQSAKRPPRGKAPSGRLNLEHLEDRLVLSASLVADLNTYTLGSNPQNIISAGGATFFTATLGNGNTELFKTDGTAAGTVQLTSGTQRTHFNSLISLFYSAPIARAECENGLALRVSLPGWRRERSGSC